MKREGRQHGMVRTYRILPTPLNPRPDTRFVNRFDSPATAGLFTRVSSKPTNHSKFTGKCGQPRCNGCHLHPVCKARDKTKGNQKMKSTDVVSNYRLLTWRVVDAGPGLNFSGASATRIVDQLSRYHMDEHDHYDDDDEEEEEEEEEEEVGDYVRDHGRDEDPTVSFSPIQSGIEISNADHDEDQVDHGDGIDDDDEDDEDEEKSFCDVGFALEQVEEDDDWCLVREM